ncbi:hypothetical protein BDV19DRAFT_347845 [Aspergillus venezuelensis]
MKLIFHVIIRLYSLFLFTRVYIPNEPQRRSQQPIIQPKSIKRRPRPSINPLSRTTTLITFPSIYIFICMYRNKPVIMKCQPIP